MQRNLLTLILLLLGLSSTAAATSPPSISRATSNTAEQIVFIDAGVAHSDIIIKDLQGSRMTVVQLGDHPINEISTFLSKHRQLGGIHLISHGSAGNIRLGNLNINQYTLSQYRQQIQNWGKSLASGAALMLYGCDIAQSGDQFLSGIADAIEAPVAASSHPVGNTQANGNWKLDHLSMPRQTLNSTQNNNSAEILAALPTISSPHYPGVLGWRTLTIGSNPAGWAGGWYQDSVPYLGASISSPPNGIASLGSLSATAPTTVTTNSYTVGTGGTAIIMGGISTTTTTLAGARSAGNFISSPLTVDPSQDAISINQFSYRVVGGSAGGFSQSSTSKIALSIIDPTGGLCNGVSSPTCEVVVAQDLSTYTLNSNTKSNVTPINTPVLLPGVNYTVRFYAYGSTTGRVIFDNPEFFVRVAVPTITLNKTVASRFRTTDVFNIQILSGSSVLSSASTGTASSATTGIYNASKNTNYSLNEIATSGSLSNYVQRLSCNVTNTILPPASSLNITLGSNFTLKSGDDLSCTITNTAKTASLTTTKTTSTSSVTYPGKIGGGYLNPTPSTISYTIRIASTGASNNVVVRDTLPANLRNITVTRAGTTVTLRTNGNSVGTTLAGPTTNGQVVEWDVGNMATGTSVNFILTATLPLASDAANPAGTLTNTAISQGDNTLESPASSASSTLIAQELVELSSDQQNLQQTLIFNTPLVFNHTITNQSNISLNSSQITVAQGTPPTGYSTTYRATYVVNGATSNIANSSVSLQDAINNAMGSYSLAPGSSLNVAITYTPSPTTQTGGSVSYNPYSQASGTNLVNQALSGEINFSDTIQIAPLQTATVKKLQARCTTSCPDITGTFASATLNLPPGAAVSYKLTATNPNNTPYVGMVLRDVIPANLIIERIDAQVQLKCANGISTLKLLYSNNGTTWIDSGSLNLSPGQSLRVGLDSNLDGKIDNNDAFPAGTLELIMHARVRSGSTTTSNAIIDPTLAPGNINSCP